MKDQRVFSHQDRHQSLKYPSTLRTDTKDAYQSDKHGVIVVSDPYRWLEFDDKERRDWAQAQDAFSTAHLKTRPDRRALNAAVKKSHSYTKLGTPFQAQDNRWYWTAQTAKNEQPVVYRSLGTDLPDPGPQGLGDIESASEIFFDVNNLSDDGSKSLTSWSFSPNGAYAAFSIATHGADVQEILIFQSTVAINSQQLASECVDSVERTGLGMFAWSSDSRGLFYTTPVLLTRSALTGNLVDAPKVMYHQVGAMQHHDEIILTGPDRGSLFKIWPSLDSNYLVLSISKHTIGSNKLWVRKGLASDDSEWIRIRDIYDGSLLYISNDGPVFTFMTNAQSDRFRVVKLTLPPIGNLTFTPIELVVDSRNIFLRQYVRINADLAVVVYTHNVKDELFLLSSKGAPQRLDDNFIGTITVSPIENGFFASFISYTSPGLIKKFSLSETTGYSWSLWRKVEAPAFRASDFVMKQVWYTSKDGTNIPMFIIHHKSTKLDGSAPSLQYGYGGNGVSLHPFFSPFFLVFAQLYGGVVAVPSIRGGSEFGKAWSDAGSKAQVGNAVDDFISATEYLVKERYVSAAKTSIAGWSAGAELVGKSVNCAPERTSHAAIANRGAHDQLRFPLFSPGSYWIGSLGDPQYPADFDFIFPVSSLHNVPATKVLPATLVVSALEDDRINSMHAYKYAATLQHNAAFGSGIQLLKLVKHAGHEDGKSTSIQVEEDVLMLGFLAQSLDLQMKNNTSGVLST